MGTDMVIRFLWRPGSDLPTIHTFLPGRKGFALEEDARKVGNLVLERIRQGNDFTISVADLKGQGITGD